MLANPISPKTAPRRSWADAAVANTETSVVVVNKKATDALKRAMRGNVQIASGTVPRPKGAGPEAIHLHDVGL
jgi:hypothetical protein